MRYLILLFISTTVLAETSIGPTTSTRGDRGLSIERTHDGWYGAVDITQNQLFWRGGKELLSNDHGYVRLGICATRKNNIVNSYLMFNTVAGLRRGRWSVDWSHCSNAGLSRPNTGYDLFTLKYKL